MGSGKPIRGRRLAFAAYMALLLAAGAATVGRTGITWDEPNYFTSSYSYLSWFVHVARSPADWWASIDRYWEQSHEAPPFFKLWAGLFAAAGALLFGTDDLGLLGNFYRMGSYALFLLAVWGGFRFVRREFGEVAAWGTALSMPLIPALFGFARLGQLDGAAAAMYLLAAIGLFRALEGRWSAPLAGGLLGLAFATKLTVFPVVPASVLWLLIYRRERGAALRLAGCFLAGAAAFFALWPWLWRAPVARTWEFLTWAGGLQDERLAYYLGEWWAGAPWHYPLVCLVALVPAVVALSGVVGAGVLLRCASSPAAGWVLLNLGFVLAVAGSGLVPVYGGPRQFLAAFPLWAVCAGVGLGWLARRLRPAAAAALLPAYVALALPGILWTGVGNSLEYYGEAVGLIPGARALGFETTYMADTYLPAVRWLNRNAPEGSTVYVQAGTYPVAESYQRTGRMRRDLRPAYLAPIAVEKYVYDRRVREGSYFLFLPRQSIYTDQMLALSKKEPLYAYEKGGVPLVMVYSGEAVRETLGIRGSPEPRDPGPANALLAGGGMVALLARLALSARGKK
ncbi:ArnT family glycosyltransferase [Rubrobacter xylanophilus]|nr:glycosyltransferase family 39 protein [Rubrobacter xylanophilus]